MRVVVVGGGVLGASAAYHAARDGAAVTVVESGETGRASAAGAGIVCPWGAAVDDAPTYALLEAGARDYAGLIAALAEDGETALGYRRVGALFAPADAAALDAVERRVRARTAPEPGPGAGAGAGNGAGAVERLAPGDAAALFPPLAPGRACLHVAGGARVDGRLLCAALARGAERRGATRLAGRAELTTEAGRCTGVRVGADVVEADAVIVAAGAWAPALLAPLGIALAVAPQRGQILHLRRPGTATGGWPSVHPMNGHYLVCFDESRVVVGASREAGSGFDHRATAGGVAGVLRAGLAMAPGLADWTLEEIRIGFRPMAADGRPMLGPAAGIDGLWVGNGLGAGGLTMGPLAGRLLALAALGRDTPLDLAPYDPLRPGLLPGRNGNAPAGGPAGA